MKDWEIFLQTIFNTEGIKVVNLTENTVEVECQSSQVKREVELFLASPSKIKASIIHSVFHTDSPVILDEEKDAIALDITPKDLIEGVLDEQFLKLIGEALKLDLTKFEHDEPKDVWAVRVGPFAGNISKRLALGSFELLQSALSHPDLGQILINGAEKIREQQPEDFISEDIRRLFVIEDLGSALKITMNVPTYNAYTKIKKFIIPPFGEVPHTTNMILDIKGLIKYFNEVIETGIVYKKEQNEELRPIVALSSVAHEDSFGLAQQPKVIILMDTSGSMSYNGFDKYKDNIIKIIDNIREKYNESEIIVHTFSDEVYSGIRFPNAADCIKHTWAKNKYMSSLEIIKGCKADGSTALHLAIKKGLSYVKVKQNDVILLCTDGEQYPCSSRGEKKILNKIEEQRNKNPQFSMFVFGIGRYDKRFFELLSKTIGSTVEDLGANFDELSLTKHMEHLSKAKTVVQFLSSTGILATMQLTPDQPKVSEQSLRREDIVRMGMYSAQGKEERGVGFSGAI